MHGSERRPLYGAVEATDAAGMSGPPTTSSSAEHGRRVYTEIPSADHSVHGRVLRKVQHAERFARGIRSAKAAMLSRA